MDTHHTPTSEWRYFAEVVSRNLLIGGEPGGGKSFPLNLLAAQAAVTGEPDDTSTSTATPAASAAGPEED